MPHRWWNRYREPGDAGPLDRSGAARHQEARRMLGVGAVAAADVGLPRSAGKAACAAGGAPGGDHLSCAIAECGEPTADAAFMGPPPPTDQDRAGVDPSRGLHLVNRGLARAVPLAAGWSRGTVSTPVRGGSVIDGQGRCGPAGGGAPRQLISVRPSGLTRRAAPRRRPRPPSTYAAPSVPAGTPQRRPP
jgi:hypothetical protein